MNIKAIFENTRILLNDLKHNTNSSSDDNFFSDKSFMVFLNDAVTEFDFNTAYTKFAYEDTEYNINIIANQNLYTYDTSLANVNSALLVTLDGTNKIRLAEIPFDVVEKTPYNDHYSYYIADVIGGTPTSFSLDYKSGQLRLYPTPTQGYNLKLRGSSYVKEYTLSELNSTLPYPARFHNYFSYYIASRCLEIIDVDAGDLSRANFYKGKFLEMCRMAKIEQMRKDDSKIVTDNGSYNAW